MRLSSVVSDLFGVSGRAMMLALIAGQRERSWIRCLPLSSSS
jgi:hypothetical protein